MFCNLGAYMLLECFPYCFLLSLLCPFIHGGLKLHFYLGRALPLVVDLVPLAVLIQMKILFFIQ